MNYYAYLAPGLFYVCGHILSNRGRLAACLERAGLPRLGRMSYSYYLSHGMIVKGLFFLVASLGIRSHNPAIFWVSLPIAYACTLLAAWTWFRAVEGPLAGFLSSSRIQLPGRGIRVNPCPSVVNS